MVLQARRTLLAQHLNCSVLNAGDGPHEHPTQGLLDILTIRQHRGSIAGLTVALVGDISHSRTARSNIWGLKKLGAHVIVCGPPLWSRRSGKNLGSKWPTAWMPSCRAAMCSICCAYSSNGKPRAPFHRCASMRLLYAMNAERMRLSKEDILIMAPGPDQSWRRNHPEVADGPHSVILQQVSNGIAVRMAALWLLLGARPAK